jgi:hypothetical protein
VWVAWRDPALRRLVGGMTVAGLVLWFGPELWGSGNALRAGERARDPNPNALAFAKHPALEVAKRYFQMTPWPVEAGLVATLGFAVARRRLGAGGLLGLTAVAWLAVVAVMTEAGFSGHARYLVAPIALASAAGGIGLGGLAAPFAARPRIIAAVVLVALGSVVAARASDVIDDGKAAANEARLMADLTAAIRAAGGRERVQAWRLNRPIARIRTNAVVPGTVFRTPPPPREITGGPPIALPPGFHQVARTKGWQVLSSCR